jgi:hypothetical protein
MVGDQCVQILIINYFKIMCLSNLTEKLEINENKQSRFIGKALH